MTRDAIVPVAPPRVVPILLAGVAGYVDACTFLGLFGLFVAQVTGSFVTAGLHAVLDWPGAVVLLAVPVFFAGGVAATVTAVAAQACRVAPLAAALALEALLLIGCIVAIAAGTPLAGPDVPLAVAAALCGIAAMGVQSALVRLLFKAVPSTNVMTTNTSQIAIDATQLLLARTLRRGPRDAATAAEAAALRARLLGGLDVAVGFLAGTVVGALAFEAAGYGVLLAPIALVAALAAWAARAHRP